MATSLNPTENCKVKISTSIQQDELLFMETKMIAKWKAEFMEFVVRHIPTDKLTTIDWVLRCRPTEVEDIRLNLVETRINGRLVTAALTVC